MLFAITSSQSYVVEPWTAFETGQIDAPPPDCRELSESELRERGEPQRGKAATFSLKPELRCEKDIIGDDERNSYYNFIARTAPRTAKRVAKTLSELQESETTKSDKPWAVTVKALNPKTEHYVRQIFLTELTKSLGSNRVVRGKVREGMSNVIVSVEKTVDPEHLLRVSAIVPGPGKPRIWTF
ncbi:MAG: hypothetical protein AB7F87_03750 [Oligoflexales bacterium]